MSGPSTPGEGVLPAWDEHDLPALLQLDRLGAAHFRNRHGDANLNGRAYGGQVLGQAMMAACMTVDAGRAPTLLQFLFLQGTDPRRPIDFEVTTLQDGKRFSSRHVRGRQGRTAVLDAHASFAPELPAPAHAAATTALESDPDSLPSLHELPAGWEAGIRRLGGYSLGAKPSIDFRVPMAAQQIAPEAAGTRFRFWFRARAAVPRSAAMQASAFAYLSDWWLNFSSLASHVRDFEPGQRVYVSSLNHCIWFHRPFEVDQWLHVDSQSPSAAAGRGLSIGTVHDLAGRLVATVSQESLMAHAEDPAGG